MPDNLKAIIESPQTEQLRKNLQEQVNSTTYSSRVESERRQALYKKDEAEKATLKKMKASVKVQY
jgi:hypothetical protein